MSQNLIVSSEDAVTSRPGRWQLRLTSGREEDGVTNRRRKLHDSKKEEEELGKPRWKRARSTNSPMMASL